jgi:putative PIG3 family NAD(P)H quinone oxidoreductase
MRAVIATRPGGPEVLEIVEVARPSPRPGEILVRNFATSLNRADLLQRRGLYPPPPGVTEILGLEFAGEVAEGAGEAAGLRRGDRVFGIVPGGAYAEFLAVDARLAMPIPDTLSFDAAAALPEAFFAADEALRTLAGTAPEETVLVHAAASGVGTAAVQLARALGASVVGTVGSSEKLERLRSLGVAEVVDYRKEDFRSAVARVSGGRGADVILDLVGAKHWERSLASIASGGRWVVLGLLGGSRVQADLGQLLTKRVRLLFTTLRHRPLGDKIAMTGRFVEGILPLVCSGDLRPVIDRVLPLEEVRSAHERMEANRAFGKIVLRM